ncbi:MAG: hypothetical protein JNM51_17585 [Bacteroidia bacterium]|nr:hypothetical protein [Bacteroidia bacterium]
MKNLKDLNILELEIYAKVIANSRDKTISRENESIMLHEFFKRYKDIHKSYIELIKAGDHAIAIEALKRALFIQWIGSFEPNYLTGIELAFDSDDSEIKSVGIELEDMQFIYDHLDNLISTESLDDELCEMLSYYSNWEFVFEYANFSEYKHLHNFTFNVVDKNKAWHESIKKRNLNHRGQMGQYFLSLN